MNYTPTARPGHRAPHAWLSDGRSTLDLFGQGLTLLNFSQNIDFNFIQESARTRKIPLRIESLDNTKIHELYERKFILVRPDGHVAWRGDEISQDFGKILDVIRGA